MNVLFISLVIITDLEKRGIYPDLIKCFIKNGHHVTILSPVERTEKGREEIIEGDGYINIRYKTLNNARTNIFEKALSTLVIDYLLKRAAKKHINRNIDLIIYATPPITLTRTITYLKSKYNALCYLLLKDISPANIADLGIIKRNSYVYKRLRKVENKLYELSDFIGCMSPANVAYALKNNNIAKDKIEICPNSIMPYLFEISNSEKMALRKKYNIKENALLFFYGGNLGKAQMVDFIVELLEVNKQNNNIHFFIVGGGVEYYKLAAWYLKNKNMNATIQFNVPKHEYDVIIKIADVGLIFLDKRFEIPNFPNRILSYMENKIPVLLATDVNTDIGAIAENNNFGKWCESGDIPSFNLLLNYFQELTLEQRNLLGLNGFNYLLKNYHVDISYEIIMSHFKSDRSHSA